MLCRFLLGRPKKQIWALVRLVIPTGLASAFLNNILLVALLLPALKGWADTSDIPTFKLLMPMNHASLLGGMLTLIGTSTNLVVAGLASESNLKDSEGQPVSCFPGIAASCPFMLT
eukprot:Plantae.Rhodophyta-Purpureofilum_apyrenoidigerum.ctg14705.p2 GENE.Plantae.Rhodophyta-Purpureofilum_apyrenoidigerum.ctg14705~~Plantae.Rhodophyta-Purpureofilum_apyrenoidigerum.ctg14705.p2  ORF type:complete len:116 (+),score=1.79 Plantae.Rhodophyta-Purpureofilum_apyrenoidigerum.ctg14705:400-747(+)